MYWKRSAIITVALVIVSVAMNTLMALLLSSLSDQLSSLADSFNTSVNGIIIAVYQANSIVSIVVTFFVVWAFLSYFDRRQEKRKRTWMAHSDDRIELPNQWVSDGLEYPEIEPQVTAPYSRSSER